MSTIERIDELRELTRGWVEDESHAAQMTDAQISLAERLSVEGLLGNWGGATYPGGVYWITLKGEIELGRPPQWWTDMSPREKATHAKPNKRTEEDYLIILSERPDTSFGEYDNTPLLFNMRKRGLIMLNPDKQSSHSGMYTSLHFVLTDAGRAALPQTEGDK